MGSAAAVKALRHDLLNLSPAVRCGGAAGSSRASGQIFIALKCRGGILLVNRSEDQRRGFPATITEILFAQGRPEFGTAGREERTE
jgi:hypothetical protein